ncbi:MAG: TIGR02449 family protein [Methylovulum sp.]|nr:TIGR02449 family protein [Methylovulum sp.]
MTQPSADQPLALKELEDKLDMLIAQYQSVKNENTALKTQYQELLQENALLLEKTTLARTKIEAMITRLKATEQDA